MSRIFISPSRYIQGNNVLSTHLNAIQELGNNALLVCDDFVYNLVGQTLETDLQALGMQIIVAHFKGESSQQAIQSLCDNAHKASIDCVIGLGGGKTLDVSKAISNQMHVPIAILPTTAATDAPTSAISVIYSKDGTIDHYQHYAKSPDLVLVDTGIICKAPPRLFASGIADAMSTWVEAQSVIKANGTTLVGASPTLAAQAIAKQCEAVLFKYGLEAMEACINNTVTQAFEDVVEANTLLSGLGFESCGLAAAHAIHNGFSTLQGDIQTLTHGEIVAYTTLTQLVLEKRPMEDLDRYITFYQALNLPTTLKDLKLEHASYDTLLKVGQHATKENETIHQMGHNYTANDVTDALFALDKYVRTHHS
ncbi:glycerol dehydrogenase [Erysipelothrix larvae]|uniref:Glycerol dehydrogenase n=1 Tax=Erysipelothrix larvae TaxID=1514105 RepID=A0A0X8GY75_9FIRM|nr:glycerol dehydrogenase [Erysipelothrix larvae]AMC92601.1 glycerol dehydrogenase [Erysipelothrix larvae]